jgi:hypothetical protein
MGEAMEKAHREKNEEAYNSLEETLTSLPWLVIELQFYFYLSLTLCEQLHDEESWDLKGR